MQANIQNLRLLNLWLEQREIRQRRRVAVVQFVVDHLLRRDQAARRFWTRSWLTQEKRLEQGAYYNLLVEMEAGDPSGFTNFLRVNSDMFYELEGRVHDRIEKQLTFLREPLEPGLRLAITLRYMATGDSYRSLEALF